MQKVDGDEDCYTRRRMTTRPRTKEQKYKYDERTQTLIAAAKMNAATKPPPAAEKKCSLSVKIGDDALTVSVDNVECRARQNHQDPPQRV